jgi:hypothetical protein
MRPRDPLKHFEETLPHGRDGLLKLWRDLAPMVRVADPSRYFSIEDAFQLDIPFPVLSLYVFRECRRALEDAPNHRVAK